MVFWRPFDASTDTIGGAWRWTFAKVVGVANWQI
jgi:hypothetical protein